MTQKKKFKLYLRELKALEEELKLFDNETYGQFSGIAESAIDDYKLWSRDRVAWALEWVEDTYYLSIP